MFEQQAALFEGLAAKLLVWNSSKQEQFPTRPDIDAIPDINVIFAIFSKH